MVTQVRVPGFTPSVNGLHFMNSFPHEAAIVVDLPPFGKIAIGDAANGLCGGMVFTVRDVAETPGMSPPPDLVPPAEGSPLFSYIVARLIDSFDLPAAGFMKYYDWMITPDNDTGWPPFFVRRGLAWKTIVEEWPNSIRPELDAGRLCPLGLVTVASLDPTQLGQNHQVLAYGYDLDGANLSLLIYDPNTAQATSDSVRIAFSLADPSNRTPISHNVNIGNPVRGLFRVPYGYNNPTGLQAPPPVALAPAHRMASGAQVTGVRELRARRLVVSVKPKTDQRGCRGLDRRPGQGRGHGQSGRRLGLHRGRPGSAQRASRSPTRSSRRLASPGALAGLELAAPRRAVRLCRWPCGPAATSSPPATCPPTWSSAFAERPRISEPSMAIAWQRWPEPALSCPSTSGPGPRASWRGRTARPSCGRGSRRRRTSRRDPGALPSSRGAAPNVGRRGPFSFFGSQWSPTFSNEFLSTANAVRWACSPSPYCSSALPRTSEYIFWAFFGERLSVDGRETLPGMADLLWAAIGPQDRSVNPRACGRGIA